MLNANRNKAMMFIKNKLIFSENAEFKTLVLEKILGLENVIFTKIEIITLLINSNKLTSLTDMQLYFILKMIEEVDNSILESENCNIENLFSENEIEQYIQTEAEKRKYNETTEREQIKKQNIVLHDVLPISDNQWMCRISLFDFQKILNSGRLNASARGLKNSVIDNIVQSILDNTFSYTCLYINVLKENTNNLSYDEENHIITIPYNAKLNLISGKYESIAVLRLFEMYLSDNNQVELEHLLKNKYFIVNLSYYNVEKEKTVLSLKI